MFGITIFNPKRYDQYDVHSALVLLHATDIRYFNRAQEVLMGDPWDAISMELPRPIPIPAIGRQVERVTRIHARDAELLESEV